MSIKKIKAQSPDPYLSKTKGDNTLARLAHVNQLVDQINATNLVGPTGAQGIQGPVGPQGVPGPVGPAGLNWQGAWTSGTPYVADDAVGYSGASYFCILATSGTTAPSSDATHWALLASQGATGAAGATGAQGPTGPQGPVGTNGWLISGNTGSNPGTEFIGTTDDKDFVVKTDDVEHLRFISTGAVTTPGRIKTAYDIYSQNNSIASTIASFSTAGHGFASIGFDTTNKGYTAIGNGTYYGRVMANNLTANRNIELPDAAGTLALQSYKVYSALVQYTAGNPTATVLENTLGVTITWATSLGNTTATASSSVFTANKTTITANNYIGPIGYTVYANIGARTNDTVISLQSIEISTSTQAAAFNRPFLVEIRVYN